MQVQHAIDVRPRHVNPTMDHKPGIVDLLDIVVVLHLAVEVYLDQARRCHFVKHLTVVVDEKMLPLARYARRHMCIDEIGPTQFV
jgi:hypothetical protein